MAAVAPLIPCHIPTDRGARELVDLGAPVINFQRLENPQTSLHQCGTMWGTQVVRSIFEKLKERDLKPAFTQLNLSDNKIGDEGARFLAEGLKGSSTIKQLLLPRTDMKPGAFKHLGALLAENSSIEEAVLSGNTADPIGMQDGFAAGLAKNKTLRSLYLSACRIQDAGCEELCKDALKVHPKLEHCSLLYNRLQAPSVKFINDVLAVNKALRYLDLSGNSLGPEGAQALVTGLKKNKGKLLKLGMAQNEINLSGCRALSKFFLSPEGKHMEFMDLRHNLVTYMGMVELRGEIGRPLDENSEEGWLLLFGTRQLFLNAH